MKTIISYQMGDCHKVKESELTLSLFQAYFFAKFGKFSIREILGGSTI